MTGDQRDLPELIADEGREILTARLQAAFADQAAAHGAAAHIDPARLEAMVQDAVRRAGGALWRRSLAEAATQELGIGLAAALAHPAVARAHELAGAPAFVAGQVAVPTPAVIARAQPATPSSPPAPDPSVANGPQALRLGAVHITGIETLRPGDRDIELRLSDAGLDVLKRSSGAAIGRLVWSEIESIDLPPPRRGLRGRRRLRELHVSTIRGRAQFELPGLTEDELREHVEPMLTRLRATDG